MENNQLQIFKNEELGEVRVIMKGDEPWFVGKDIAGKLGYTTLQKMYSHIDNEDKIKINPQTEEYQGLCQNGTYLVDNKNTFSLMLINESGLYSSIFGSKLPQAKKFKKWITSEVLPSLRKNGTYSITTQQPSNMVANLVQTTMTAILPVITEQMAKVTIQTQEQINQMAGLMHDQSEIYDADREHIKEMIGFRSVNTTRMVKTTKEKLSDKLGYNVMANNPIFLKVKNEVFKEFKVIKWEDIPVEGYNAVFAFVDTYIDDNVA